MKQSLAPMHTAQNGPSLSSESTLQEHYVMGRTRLLTASAGPTYPCYCMLGQTLEQ